MTAPAEMTIARKLVTAALHRDYTVSVNDGEEWTVKRSRKMAEICAALATTDCDSLRFRDAAGNIVGSVALIWGNGEDLISDHTDNEAVNALVKAAE